MQNNKKTLLSKALLYHPRIIKGIRSCWKNIAKVAVADIAGAGLAL